MRGSSGPLSKGVPSRRWRFFISPVIVRVRPPPLPSFQPPVVSGNDHINSDAPIPPPKLIVNSTVNTGNNASTDTSGDEGGDAGGEDGL